MRHRVTRRDFLRLLGFGLLDLFLLSIAGAAYGFLIEPGLFKIERVPLKLRRLVKMVTHQEISRDQKRIRLFPHD